MSTITFDQPTIVRSAKLARSQRSTIAAVRLTLRGKIVVVTAVLAFLAIVALVFTPGVVATSEAGAAQEVQTVRVAAGETLWQIAADANPDGDIRNTIDEILQLNSLSSASDVLPGAELAVPVY